MSSDNLGVRDFKQKRQSETLLLNGKVNVLNAIIKGVEVIFSTFVFYNPIYSILLRGIMSYYFHIHSHTWFSFPFVSVFTVFPPELLS